MKITFTLLLALVAAATIVPGDRAEACGGYFFADELVLAALSDDSSKSVVAFQKLAEPNQNGLNRALRHRLVFEIQMNRAENQSVHLRKLDMSAMTPIQQTDHQVRIAKKELEKAQAMANRVRLESLIARLQAAVGDVVAAK